MAEHSAIEWCDATFNPWIGCTKVSPACDHCYAAVSTPARVQGVEWGAGQARRRTSAGNWKLPLRWNRADFHQCGDCGWRGEVDTLESDCCPACGRHEKLDPARRRVFCASLADVFDNEVPDEWRMELFRLMANTANLQWMVLTKRIGNVRDYTRRDGLAFDLIGDGRVWIGATICNQAEADRDIPKLMAVPAAVRFLSMEPLLGPVDLKYHFFSEPTGKVRRPGSRLQIELRRPADGGIHWVIVGGESGKDARPVHPDWVRTLNDQCAIADVPFLFKQWGEWLPADDLPSEVQEHYDVLGRTAGRMVRVGKKRAGRELDGHLHTAFPGVR